MSKSVAKAGEKLVQLTLPLSSLPTANLAAGSLRVQEAVNEALREALARSGLDREYVAKELSRLTGEPYSIHTINNWAAESKSERRIPLEAAAALAVILSDISILQAAVAPAGMLVMNREQAVVYELGLMAVEERKRGRKKRELWERLNGREDS